MALLQDAMLHVSLEQAQHPREQMPPVAAVQSDLLRMTGESDTCLPPFRAYRATRLKIKGLKSNRSSREGKIAMFSSY